MHLIIIQIISAALLGLIYNVAIDKYVDQKVSQWTEEKIPLMIHQRTDIAFKSKSVSELRRTISKRSGIVECNRDRKSWNAWLTDNKSESLVLTPGTYTFAYRSYGNYEEAGAMKASLFHIKTMLGLTFRRRGTMTIDRDGKHVSIKDYYRVKGKKVDVTWNGIMKNNVPGNGKQRIEWTDTLSVMGKKRTVNHPKATAARKIPWDVVKMEDGMIAFQRGNVGMLVYDLNPVW